MQIHPTPYVSDIKYKKLTWKERLKSLKPWVKFKLVEDPTIFILDDTIICSFKTAQKIEKGLVDLSNVKNYSHPDIKLINYLIDNDYQY